MDKGCGTMMRGVVLYTDEGCGAWIRGVMHG